MWYNVPSMHHKEDNVLGVFGMIRIIFREYRTWHKNWDDLCNQCGKCCYKRYLSPKGAVIVDQSSPCQYLDAESKKCRIYQHRFATYDYCGKVTLYAALFYPLLPEDCAYVRTFRIWRRRKNTARLTHKKGEKDNG